MTVEIRMEWENENLRPEFGSEYASGMDLKAKLDAPVTLDPLERKLIHTGIRMSMPIGYEAQVRPRSGNALKKGITVLNSPGTIDADYRGEIGVILVNVSNQSVVINPMDKIAQLVISPVVHNDLMNITEAVIHTDDTDRGAGGFGHTGE